MIHHFSSIITSGYGHKCNDDGGDFNAVPHAKAPIFSQIIIIIVVYISQFSYNKLWYT